MPCDPIYLKQLTGKKKMKMLLKIKLLLITLMVWSFPLISFAATAEAAPQAWWQSLVYAVIQFALAILIPILGYLAIQVLQRYGIKLEQEQVDSIAKKAADFADQKARVALKVDGEKTPGADKMTLALGFAKTLAHQYNLKEKATGKLQDVIEAAVAKKKADKPVIEAKAPEVEA